MPLSRRYQAYRMLQNKRLIGRWASDTMDAQKHSLYGNKHAQVLSNGAFFADIYSMARKSHAGIAFKKFIIELEVPKHLAIDVYKDNNTPGTDLTKS